MKKFLENLPVPFAGLMLGTVATGNLLLLYSTNLHTFFTVSALTMLALILLRLAFFRDKFRQELQNPLLASVAATFFMALFFLSAALAPLLGELAAVVWWLTLIAYSLYNLQFPVRFFRKFALENVSTGFLIIYIGPVAASNTAAAFGLQAVGRVFFWLGLAFVFPVLALIAARYLKHPVQPGEAPLYGIFADPINLPVKVDGTAEFVVLPVSTTTSTLPDTGDSSTSLALSVLGLVSFSGAAVLAYAGSDRKKFITQLALKATYHHK